MPSQLTHVFPIQSQFAPQFARASIPIIKPLGQQIGQLIAKTLNHTPAADKILMWSGLMYVPAAVLTPIITNAQLKTQHTPEYERRLLVQSEIMRQMISATVHFIGYYGGMALPGLFSKGKRVKGATTVKRLLGGVLGTTIMSAFVRPIALNTYMARWVKNQHGSEAPSTLPAAAPLSPNPSATPFYPSAFNPHVPFMASSRMVESRTSDQSVPSNWLA